MLCDEQCVTSGSRGPWGPPCPQEFFKIMQFSTLFSGKTPILSKCLAQGPPGKNSAGPPWPKSWIRHWFESAKRWFLFETDWLFVSLCQNAQTAPTPWRQVCEKWFGTYRNAKQDKKEQFSEQKFFTFKAIHPKKKQKTNKQKQTEKNRPSFFFARRFYLQRNRAEFIGLHEPQLASIWWVWKEDEDKNQNVNAFYCLASQ